MALAPYIDENGDIVYPEDPNPGGPSPWPRDPAPGPQAPNEDPPPVTGTGTGTKVPPTTTDPGPGPGPGPFTGTYTAPTPGAYPALPTVPDAPLPNLPGIEKPPPFAYDPYQDASPFSFQDYSAPTPFKAPSAEEALQDPGYQFRKQQGEDSLQRWAAARGTLNDTGTANALTDYGQNAASQEYSNVWNRDWNAYNTNEANRFNVYKTNRGNALDTFNVNEGNRFNTYTTNRAGAVQQYNTNYQTQYADPYEHAYKAAIDTWIPQEETWRAGVDMSRLGYTTQTGVVQHNNDLAGSNAWAKFLQDWAMWKDNRDTGIGLAGA